MVESSIPFVDETLAPWRTQLAGDYAGYRNHVHRMAHFCLALYPGDATSRQKILIAACFHDLGIWTENTIDYLPPSSALASEYLNRNGLAGWDTEIRLMIDMHHKLRRYDGALSPLVEPFRRADLTDLSFGAVKWGLPAALIKEVKAAFPDAGFHQRLMQLAGQWFARHPLRPPPFLKW
jgi:predicted metal-dependent HD superfamily phosphohydrolase